MEATLEIGKKLIQKRLQLREIKTEEEVEVLEMYSAHNDKVFRNP